MIRIVIIAAALLALVLLLRHFNRLDAPARKRFWAWFSFGLLFAGVIFLTLTGRLHYIAAIVTAVLPFAKRMLPLVRYIPLLRRLYKERKEGEAEHAKPTTVNLGLDEAYQVLGLEKGATKDDVVDAHRKLMQKLHPDRGGNDYLAARLNQAKDLLIKHLS